MSKIYVEAEECEMTLEQMAFRVNELSDICEQYKWQYDYWKAEAFKRNMKIIELEQKLAKLEAK